MKSNKFRVEYLNSKHFKLLQEREHQIFPEEKEDEPKDKIYAQWFKEERNLSSIWINPDTDDLEGLIAIISVNKKGWNYIHDVSSNDIDEYQLKGDNLFRPGFDKEIGFHVYMIEKLDKSITNFTELAYSQIFRNLKSKMNSLGSPNIIGLSGYVASVEAINIAINLLGRNEYKKLDTYMFLDKNSKLVVKDDVDQENLSDLIDRGFILRNRARLLSIYREDPSIVWKWLDDVLKE